jgi:hypothetical protein
MSKKLEIVLFAFFAIVGAGIFYSFGIRPVLKAFDAEKWQQTPCKIITAEVGGHSDNDGTTYSIDITYEYQFEGKAYRSDKYYFVGALSRDYKSTARIVDKYKQAKNPICCVNPRNPSEAVLFRRFPGLLFIFSSVIFLAVGVGGLVSILKKTVLTGNRPQVFKTQQGLATGVLRVADSLNGKEVRSPFHSGGSNL